MPSATAPGFLLDRFGRPAVFGGTGNLYRDTRADEDLRPKPPSLFADFLSLLSPRKYRELVTACRTLASRGLVSAALEQRADYASASHYRPRFTGTDEAYGADLLAAVEDSLTMCNLRGPRFDWRTTWRLSSVTRATDGSLFILLTEWADTGWPALQIFEGHRIGQRDTSTGTVGPKDAFTMIPRDGNAESAKGAENSSATSASSALKKVRGVYAGLPINQGIIYNAAGQEVAYRVLGPADDGSEDQDISARDMIHVARPRRHSEGRPVPELAPAALDFLAIDAAQTAALDILQLDAKIGVVETNETGKADPSLDVVAMGPKLDGSPTQVVDRGSWFHVKSGKGKLEPWHANRPSDQWMNLDMRVSKRALAAIRWRLEMLDPQGIGAGAANRAFQDQINTTIQDEFQIDRPAAIRVLRYFAAKLIKQGVLPNHEEARALDVAPPPYFEVDRASAKYDLEDVAAGRSSMTMLRLRDGHTDEELYTTRAVSYEKALKIQKKHPDVPLEIILGDLGLTAARSGYYPANDPTPDPTAPQPDATKPAAPATPPAK